jgi:hypothetical protein
MARKTPRKATVNKTRKTTRTRKVTEETKPITVAKPEKPKAKPKKVKSPFVADMKAPALSALAYVVDDNTSKTATVDEVAEGSGYESTIVQQALTGLVGKGFASKKGDKFKLTEMGQQALKK